MNKIEAQKVMEEMKNESIAKGYEIGKPMGCLRTFNGVKLYVTTNCGERWHINGVMKSKAKALAVLVTE